MGYSSNVYKAAADRLFERRLKAEKEADRRKAEIYKKLPRTRELEKEISRCGIQAARAVIGGGDVAEEMKNLRDRNLAMQAELAEILTSNGYDKNVFEPSYRCKRCNDTGYYEENGRTLYADNGCIGLMCMYNKVHFRSYCIDIGMYSAFGRRFYISLVCTLFNIDNNYIIRRKALVSLSAWCYHKLLITYPGAYVSPGTDYESLFQETKSCFYNKFFCFLQFVCHTFSLQKEYGKPYSRKPHLNVILR